MARLYADEQFPFAVVKLLREMSQINSVYVLLNELLFTKLYLIAKYCNKIKLRW